MKLKSCVALASVMCLGFAFAANAQFQDTFNSYTSGTYLNGQGGWTDTGGNNYQITAAGGGVAGTLGVNQGTGSYQMNWTAHPWDWTTLAVGDKVVVSMDFQANGSGTFDDDRVGWVVGSNPTSSSYHFGVQLDQSDQGGGLVTYFRDNGGTRVGSSSGTLLIPMATLAPSGANWYREQIQVTKQTSGLGAGGAKVDVTFSALDGSGNVSGTPLTANTTVDTSTTRGFTGTVFPMFKNYSIVTGGADNASFEIVSGAPPPPVTDKYVIAISVDGMGSKWVTPLLASSSLPNIARFIAEGAGTLNARDDADRAVTMQNHVDMVTGRGTLGATGHNWDVNGWPDGSYNTLAEKKGSYVASMFDVAHDNAMRTGMWAGKGKFNLLTTSYNATNGAADVTGADNGKNKLDTSNVSDGVSAATLTTAFTTAMTANPFNLSFIHYQDPDAAGHGSGWGSATYNTSLMAIDTEIGHLLTYIAGNATLNGNTTIILTADHGGTGTGHGDITNANDYTIPFLVWGAGVGAGDLYGMNSLFRLSPLTTGGAAGNPPFSDIMQPIRNGELGNLALDLLGLGPIPGSTIDFAQDLVLVLVPEPAALALGAMAFAGLLTWRRRAA